MENIVYKGNWIENELNGIVIKKDLNKKITEKCVYENGTMT